MPCHLTNTKGEEVLRRIPGADYGYLVLRVQLLSCKKRFRFCVFLFTQLAKDQRGWMGGRGEGGGGVAHAELMEQSERMISAARSSFSSVVPRHSRDRYRPAPCPVSDFSRAV